MVYRADEQCFHCQKGRPYDVMVPGEMLRPAIIDTIKKRDRTWTPVQMICVDCLDLFRSEYVEDALKDEVGELTKLEQEVIDSLREQETLTENINLAFEKHHVWSTRRRSGRYLRRQLDFYRHFFLSAGDVDRYQQPSTSLRPYDPYPYILLNLILSCLAALQAPIIMMSQNRIEARDRLRSENDYQVNLKAELEIRHLKARCFTQAPMAKLLEIQQIQMDFMKELMHRTQDERKIS
jgi:uncharacterized membrane protein